MRRTRVRWEAYVTRFEDALDRYKQGRLTAEEAGELLGLSGRHFRRQCEVSRASIRAFTAGGPIRVSASPAFMPTI